MNPHETPSPKPAPAFNHGAAGPRLGDRPGDRPGQNAGHRADHRLSRSPTRTDAVTGAPSPGIGNLEAAFEAANPDIDLDVTNIPWGEGATGYAPKTEAMIQANEACLYEMPGAAGYAPPRLAGQPRHAHGLPMRISRMSGARRSTTLRIWGPDNPNRPLLHPQQYRRARHPLGRQAVRALRRRAAVEEPDARRDRRPRPRR